MIITRKDFAKKVGLSDATTYILFDRFNLKAIDSYKQHNISYDISWYDLQKIKDFLLQRDYDYSDVIKNINKMGEE